MMRLVNNTHPWLTRGSGWKFQFTWKKWSDEFMCHIYSDQRTTNELESWVGNGLQVCSLTLAQEKAGGWGWWVRAIAGTRIWGTVWDSPPKLRKRGESVNGTQALTWHWFLKPVCWCSFLYGWELAMCMNYLTGKRWWQRQLYHVLSETDSRIAPLAKVQLI